MKFSSLFVNWTYRLDDREKLDDGMSMMREGIVVTRNNEIERNDVLVNI